MFFFDRLLAGYASTAASLDAFFAAYPQYAVPMILFGSGLLSAFIVHTSTSKEDFVLGFYIFVVFCLISTLFACGVLLSPSQSAATVVSVVTGLVSFWGILFHWSFRKWSLNLTRKLGKGWAKAIDYPYLLAGGVGLLRLALSNAGMAFQTWDCIAVIAVSIALALRLTKTTIEVLKWDDPQVGAIIKSD